MKRYQVSKYFTLTLIAFMISLGFWTVYFIGDVHLRLARPLLGQDYGTLKDGTYVRIDVDTYLTGEYGNVCAASGRGLKTYQYYTVLIGNNQWVRFGASEKDTLEKLGKYVHGKGKEMHLTARVDRDLIMGLDWYQKSAKNFDTNALIKDFVLSEASIHDYATVQILANVFLIAAAILFITIGGIRRVYVRPFEDTQRYKDCFFGRGFDLDKQLEKEKENLKRYQEEQKNSWKSYGIGAALLLGGIFLIGFSVLLSMFTMIQVLFIGGPLGIYMISMSFYWFVSGFVNSDSEFAHKISDTFLLRTTSVKIEECYKMIHVLKKHVEKNETAQEKVKMWYGPGAWEEEEGDSGNESDAAE